MMRKTDDKSIRILNRLLEWRKSGITYEADPRHVEIVLNDLDMKNCATVGTPGVELKVDPDNDPALDATWSSKYRQITARCNFLAQDRCDIQYAVKVLAKAMSAPKASDLERLKRLARYLKGRPRYVMHFERQANVYALNGFTDSDFAGDTDTRKSTSGGCIHLGDHVIKSWSTTQTVIALSSGEAEFYGLTRCGSIGMGIQSLLLDLGIDLQLRVITDATTGLAIASRRGHGKVRHIATHELWIQDHVLRGRILIVKIKNNFNSADLFAKYLEKSKLDEAVGQLLHR